MLIYWVWFSMLTGISLRQKLALLERFSDPEEIYGTDCLPEGLELDRDLGLAEAVVKDCKRRHIGILPFGDKAYPVRLRNISDPPLVLYYKGILPDFDKQPAIGVVGTRKASAYGLNAAQTISRQIAASGGLVVSGGASGVDTWALQGALDADAPAVTVLGCGADVVYPRTNRRIFAQIEEKGCILSEYLPGTQPKPWQFPERNRIISGISNGVLVVEAPEKSGALITAQRALEQGRDVFVVPGNIDVETCSGSNALLQEGAYAVFSGWDTLKDYAAQYPQTVKPGSSEPSGKKIPVFKQDCGSDQHRSDKKDVDIPEVKPYSVIDNGQVRQSDQEQLLLSCMDRRPIPVDEVIARSGLPAGVVLGMLTKLALRGEVIHHPGKLVSRNKQ